MPDTSKENQEHSQSVAAKNLNADTKNTQKESVNTQRAISVANLPVLAKDEYYLSRLERELARASLSKKPTSKNPAANKNTNTNTDSKHHAKSSNDLDKKRAQYEQLKTRSQQAVQARIESIPDRLAEKLNQDLPVSQRGDDLIQAIIDNQVIIIAGETGSGKTTQLPKLAMLAGRGIRGQIGHT